MLAHTSVHRAFALALACALALLAAPRAEAQARTNQTSSSAGASAELFRVPSQSWADINGLVFLIAFDVEGTPGAVNVEYARRFRSLASHSRLRAAARTWGTETFSRLQQVAAELGRADAAVAPASSAHLAQLNASATLAARQLEELENVARGAILEYRQRGFRENPWISLGPPPGDVQSALGLVRGQWGALLSDLTDVQRLLASRDAVDLEVARNTWAEVVAAARAFAAGMPAQARVLRGEHYYDHCPLREDATYALVNSFVDDRNMALALVNNQLRMAPRPARTTPAFRWRFSKAGQGWWRLGNLAQGARWSLDVARRGNYYAAHLADVRNVSGQLWRCMPARAGGWLRLINSFQGELRSLDTFRDTLQGFMADTENRSGQYWRFVELAP